MTPEEITAMAKEAGMNPNSDPDAINALGKSVPLAWIEKLCALVAEKAAARATEACAVLALDKAGTTDYDYSTCINLADAIRARGQKGGA